MYPAMPSSNCEANNLSMHKSVSSMYPIFQQRSKFKFVKYLNVLYDKYIS